MKNENKQPKDNSRRGQYIRDFLDVYSEQPTIAVTKSTACGATCTEESIIGHELFLERRELLTGKRKGGAE